ncbi:hypothetical protein H8S37_14565 [Mediterraneibacter sp. NSJ-55]|uniref:Uncharacterized protein n=1 Tax=Mediterraneibacter hominis TaxID=2763054 RepID=A0A923RTB8_9FIRM|nr:hypothetical protein [Mediterraneibacter hominis]MBC5690137.1 hypothetical protein [Mediterraneibacter hominis]
MKIHIKTPDGHNIKMPVPVGCAAFFIQRLPDSLFKNVQNKICYPFNTLLTKEIVSLMLSQCTDIIKENKGLEVIHIEAKDGTYVSVQF